MDLKDIISQYNDAVKNGDSKLADALLENIARGNNGGSHGGSYYDYNRYTPSYKREKQVSSFQSERKEEENFQKHVQERQKEIAALTDITEKTKAQAELDSEINEHLEDRGGLFKQIKHAIGLINDDVLNIHDNLRGSYNSLKSITREWGEIDAAASHYTKTLGGTKAALDNLRKSTLNNVVKNRLAADFNISTQELLAAQENYSKAAGRNIRIDNSGQANIAAMQSMGMNAADWGATFDTFGMSINNVADHVGKMFSDASKEGLSFDKISNDVKANIKIAQNYTFKDGIKGLESMAKKAAAIKLDMQVAASVAGKVNTVEGAIDVASKLQVLGGSFANFADPMGMLNEGLNDMEGLQDRIAKMIGGLGSFNKATGEVEVSAFNKQRIAAAAQAMGVSSDQLMQSVNAQARRGEVEKQMTASKNARGLNKDMQELIKNSATFDENGKAGVSINGQFKSIDELTNNDYEELVKETQSESEDIKDIAKNVRSLVDVQGGAEKQTNAVKAQMSSPIARLEKGVTKGLGRANWFLGIIAASNIIGGLRGVFRGLGNAGNIIGTGPVGNLFNKLIGKFNGGGSTGAVPNAILGKGAGKFSGLFSKTVTSSTGKQYILKGGKLFNANGVQMRGKVAENILKSGKSTSSVANAIKGFENGAKGLSNAVKGIATKATGGIVKGGAKRTATRALIKTFGKEGAKKVAGIGTKLAAGAAKGGGVGIIGAVGNIATDMLVDSGKIKKGGGAHSAMKVGSTALEGAGLGMMVGSVIPGIGTAIGAAIGAIGGAVVGGIKAAKAKNEVIVDNQLESLGIERKGNYSSKNLKKIDKALATGQMSNKLRRKLIKNGDTDIANQIKSVEAQNRENEKGGEKAKKNIAKASFIVNHATFTGRGLRGGNMINPVMGLGLVGDAIQHAFRGKPEEGRFEKIRRGRGLLGQLDEVRNRNNSNGENDFNININGSLKLEGGNGQSVDIINIIKKDPKLQQDLANLLRNRILQGITQTNTPGKKTELYQNA